MVLLGCSVVVCVLVLLLVLVYLVLVVAYMMVFLVGSHLTVVCLLVCLVLCVLFVLVRGRRRHDTQVVYRLLQVLRHRGHRGGASATMGCAVGSAVSVSVVCCRAADAAAVASR